VVEFDLKLKLILRIITYLTYICWEIDNFVIKSDIFRRFFICKNILKKLSCYHDNNFGYFMFGKYNGFVSKARVSAFMYFLVYFLNLSPSILFESKLVGPNLELHYDSVFVSAKFILKRLFANPICAIIILSL
jgi:hypothetical protein